MTYKVIIMSKGIQEVEWTEEIESTRSMRAAKNKATRWIKKNIFESDYDEIVKEDVGRRRSYWTLTNPQTEEFSKRVMGGI